MYFWIIIFATAWPVGSALAMCDILREPGESCYQKEFENMDHRKQNYLQATTREEKIFHAEKEFKRYTDLLNGAAGQAALSCHENCTQTQSYLKNQLNQRANRMKKLESEYSLAPYTINWGRAALGAAGILLGGAAVLAIASAIEGYVGGGGWAGAKKKIKERLQFWRSSGREDMWESPLPKEELDGDAVSDISPLQPPPSAGSENMSLDGEVDRIALKKADEIATFDLYVEEDGVHKDRIFGMAPAVERKTQPASGESKKRRKRYAQKKAKRVKLASDGMAAPSKKQKSVKKDKIVSASNGV